jgi:hypothetical protein
MVSESQFTEQKRAKKARQHFFIPVDPVPFFKELDEAASRSSLLFREISKSFRRNLESVMLTVSVPFQLSAAASQRLRFQQLHIAEKIRSQTRIDEGKTEEEAHAEAFTIAEQRMADELKLPETIDRLSNQILESLEQSLASEEFARASAELLRQGVVSVWSALEVLAQDLIVSLLNARPDLAVELLTHERTKALFQLKAIPLETLAVYNYDVSASFGDILIRHRSIDTTPAMKAVFMVLLPKCSTLIAALDQKELWILNQRRHLFVHRRGIVDAAYLSKTGETLSIGTELCVSPNDLEKYLSVVMNAGVELINEVSKHY